jgi:hypothetical protein
MQILKASDVSVGKELLGYACFATATATNNNANLPIIRLYR